MHARARALAGDPRSKRGAAAEQRAKAGLAVISAERASLQRILTVEFPDCAALSNPPLMMTKEIQSLLSGDEAMMLLAVKKPAAAIPEKFDGYREAAWLSKRHAGSVLPSVASLKLLRAFARQDHGIKPMTGFGDPLLAHAARRLFDHVFCHPRSCGGRRQRSRRAVAGAQHSCATNSMAACSRKVKSRN